MLRSGMLLGSLALLLALAVGCTQRGVQDQGWIELDQHHAYHASAQGDGRLLLSVSTLHAAYPGDDGLSLLPEAREAFRTTAIALGDPLFDPDALVIDNRVTGSGVRSIILTGVVSR